MPSRLEVEPEPRRTSYSGELVESDARVPFDGSPYDEYTVELRVGEALTLLMASEEFNSYLLLIGPRGSALVQDDDSGEGDNSRIDYTVTASGTYRVRANSYDGTGRGRYRLVISVRDAL